MKQQSKQSRKLLIVVIIFFAIIFIAANWSTGQRNATKQPINNHRVLPTNKLKAKPQASKVELKLIGTTNQQLQAQLSAKLQNIGFIGTGIIAEKGQIGATWANGDANASTGQKNTLNTPYNINSMQKCVTGVLMMQQIQQGRLQLTDKLADYYPQIANSQNITIAQMLTMTSGLTMASMGSGTYVSDQATIADDIARLQFQPQWYNKMTYQPINYVLMAGILEQVTGQSYQELFEKGIAEPLNLTDTTFGYDLGTMTVPLGYGGPLSNPYRQVVALDPNQQHFELGTGQLYMSAADFYLFIRSALNGTLITVANASRVPMVVVFIIRLMALKLPMVPA
ncbi:serine hydrolase domain-containing protein [Lapidilactobacillus gannanensis]|uniref:Serine hydrolase domain-containing protein n=1 Tax=Lapidilactobacillus gannanensis TaxID=2486002 RepID=A0ABW4BM80_9LACO|nr:serine hydrolase domain-containing protein [Lapidilactobacillus gannanensis]